MPTRDKYPRDYFLKNPFRGETPEGVYRRLRWGRRPRESWEIKAPESMATLGILAKLVFEDSTKRFSEKTGPFVAVGVESNRVYLVPRAGERPIGEIPNGPYHEVGPLLQIDYVSAKGREDAYYYHEHEPPFPVLLQEPRSRVCVIEPVPHGGGRSYAVSDEGIIG